MQSDLGLSSTSFLVARVKDALSQNEMDILAIEEPLEIRLGYELESGLRERKTVSITMRTPGHDFELALGFLYTEGIIESIDEIDSIKHCGPTLNKALAKNIVIVELKAIKMKNRLAKLDRHFYTSSSCGVCGKTSIEALKIQSPFMDQPRPYQVPCDFIHRLPEMLRASQSVFENTGGLHASGIFSKKDGLILVREDVGRHNALDKVIGYCLLNKLLPLSEVVLLVSGRASFELVQKAAMAGIQIMAAVGAPSSLAVELAIEMNMTLLGFVRNQRFNIYHAEQRILKSGAHDEA